MPEVTEANHSALIQVIDISRQARSINKLELEDLADLKKSSIFSFLSIDIPLPRRDVDKDEGQKRATK